jgi:hypothetical protein
MRILLVEPQKSKKYHTPYPPLGLLNLSAYHKRRRNSVRFVQGISDDGFLSLMLFTLHRYLPMLMSLYMI